jgi:hypothetical protein
MLPQVSAMALSNDPDCGFTVTVNVPVSPAGIVTVAGDALNDSVVGGGVGGVVETGEQADVKPTAPLI